MDDRDSAHAEILAAAAHFPRWARAMDGVSVPYIWLSGYHVTDPEGSAHLRLPGLAWVGYRKTLSFTVDRIDRAHSGWASPVVWEPRVGASPVEAQRQLRQALRRRI